MAANVKNSHTIWTVLVAIRKCMKYCFSASLFNFFLLLSFCKHLMWIVEGGHAHTIKTNLIMHLTRYLQITVNYWWHCSSQWLQLLTELLKTKICVLFALWYLAWDSWGIDALNKLVLLAWQLVINWVDTTGYVPIIQWSAIECDTKCASVCVMMVCTHSTRMTKLKTEQNPTQSIARCQIDWKKLAICVNNCDNRSRFLCFIDLFFSFFLYLALIWARVCCRNRENSFFHLFHLHTFTHLDLWPDSSSHFSKCVRQ